jgi:hypothetical protein
MKCCPALEISLRDFLIFLKLDDFKEMTQESLDNGDVVLLYTLDPCDNL